MPKPSEHLQKFYDWAKDNPKSDSSTWEVAVLAFYSNQTEELRSRLQKYTGSKESFSFVKKNGNDPSTTVMTIVLHTIDSFQGHEADIVFLSIANDDTTIFLENRNRLNVAITRARYQNVIVGNREVMKKSKTLLGVLASETSLHGGRS